MRLADSWVTTGEHVVKKPTAWAPLFCDAQAVFCVIGNDTKNAPRDAHSREEEICRKRPRSARECAKAHSFLTAGKGEQL